MALLPYIAQTEQEAWMSFIVACSMVGGSTASSKELYRINQLCTRSAILPKNITDTNLFKSVGYHCLRYGSKSLVDGSIGRIHKDDYPTLFTYCCEVIYAEGQPTTDKQNLLKHIAYLLQVTADFFKACITYQRAHSFKDDFYLS